MFLLRTHLSTFRMSMPLHEESSPTCCIQLRYFVVRRVLRRARCVAASTPVDGIALSTALRKKPVKYSVGLCSHFFCSCVDCAVLRTMFPRAHAQRSPSNTRCKSKQVQLFMFAMFSSAKAASHSDFFVDCAVKHCASGCNTPAMATTCLAVPITQPPCDQKAYRHITLSNQMQALLIHDPSIFLGGAPQC
jgi:hypothetical protein